MRMIGGALTIEATREQIELYIAQHDRLGHSCWAVLDRQTGAMTGEAGLVPLGGEGPPIELGYAFGTAFWGRGLATEVGRAIRAEAFGTLVANDGPAGCAARARSPSPRSSSPDRSRAGARTRGSHPPPRPAPGSARPHPAAAPAAAPPPWPGRRCRRSAVLPPCALPEENRPVRSGCREWIGAPAPVPANGARGGLWEKTHSGCPRVARSNSAASWLATACLTASERSAASTAARWRRTRGRRRGRGRRTVHRPPARRR